MPIRRRDLYKEVATLEKAHDIFFTTMAFDNLLQTDKIIRDKGRGSLDYYDMMVDSDAHLAGLIETRIDAVTGLDWEIKPVTEDEEDLRHADFITFCFERMGDFEKTALAGLLRAIVTGFAVAEVVWEDITWEGEQKLVPAKILLRRSQRFRFDATYTLRLLSRENATSGEEVDQFKFMVHSFRPRYSNPYGVSVLRACYWPWWFKHHSFTWWLKAAEKGAEGTAIVTYPEHANEAEIAQFEDAAKRLLLSKYAAVREGASFQFPQIKIDPNFSDNLVGRCNSEMRFRVMGSTLSSGTEGSGSRALGQVHEGRFQERIEADSKSVMAAFNTQLIKWMIDLNFAGERATYPKFKLNYEPSKDTKAISEVIDKAVGWGMPIAVKDAADLLNLPLAQEGEELLQAPKVPEPAPAEEEEPEEEEEEEPSPEEAVEEEGEASAGRLEGAIRWTYTPKSALTAAANTAVVNRAAYLQERIDKLEQAAVEDGLPIYAELGDQIKEWVGGYNGLLQALDNLGSLNLDMTELSLYLRDSYFWSELVAYHDVYNLPKTRKVPKVPSWIQRIINRRFGKDPWDSWAPVDPETAIEIFKSKDILERYEYDLLEAEARRNALTAARMSKDTIEKKLAPALTKAIQGGTSQAAFVKEVDDIVLSRAHANTIFRTNVLSAYNDGHAEAIFSPNMKDLIPGFQFIAVMDDRTTPMCAERNDAIYSRDDMITLGIVPPLHFNCRSTLVGIYADEWPGKRSLAPTIPTERGFGKWTPNLPARRPVPTPVSAPSTPIRPQTPPEAGFSPSSDVKGAWPGYKANVRDDLEILLRRMGISAKEKGAIYSSKGVRAGRLLSGGKSSINMNPGYKVAYKKKWYEGLNSVHSHPSGGSQSGQDLYMALWTEASKREIVLGKDYVYILEKTGNVPIQVADQIKFAKLVRSNLARAYNEASWEATKSAAKMPPWTELSTKTIRKFVDDGIEYGGKKYKPFKFTRFSVKDMDIDVSRVASGKQPAPLVPKPSIAISKKGKKAWASYSKQIADDIDNAWAAQKTHGKEVGGLYSNQGKRVGKVVTGLTDELPLEKELARAAKKGLRGLDIVHTHPDSTALSMGDISFITQQHKNVRRIVSVGDNHLNVLEILPHRMPRAAIDNIDDFAREAAQSWKDFLSDYRIKLIDESLEAGGPPLVPGTWWKVTQDAMEEWVEKGITIENDIYYPFKFTKLTKTEMGINA